MSFLELNARWERSVEIGPAEVVEYIALAIEAMAILIITFASLQAFIRVLRVASGTVSAQFRRQTYLEFLRWLVAALTFLLAADIISTSIAPSWEEIGRVAAVAAIRTFLAYFTEQDVREIAEAAEATEPERASEAGSRVNAGPVRGGSLARPESMTASHRE